MKAPVASDSVIRITRIYTATYILLGVIMLALLVVGSRPAEAAASPVTLSLSVMKEQRKAAADGTTAVNLVPAAHTVPGDRLVYVLTYVNTGKQPVSGMVVDYPLPRGVTYRAAADGSPAPQVSADGSHFGPVTGADPTAITALRWQLAGDVAPGAQGKISFKATLN